ncbi:hypothetical protein CJU89_0989 [Yarrowia sp. B02]|nr:hypothetical protein CJU89_0989 [Yarrowia sp. B02]
MDAYKPYAGPESSNQTSFSDDSNLYHTPRLPSPAAFSANSSRHTSASPLAASADRDQLPYPISYVSNPPKTQRPTSPLSRSPGMLPPQAVAHQRFSPCESPALSRQSSQRRTRSSTVNSDDGRSVFMSEFRKQSGSGLRPDMKTLCPDQTAADQAIASDDDAPIPGALPIPRSEPMERQSSSKRSSKIFARGRTPSDGSIAGDDAEFGFRAKVSKLLKTKDSKPDLIADILADEAASGNAHVYEEHMKQKLALGVSHKIDIESQTAASQYYPQVPIPPAGAQLDGYAQWDAMMYKQQLEYASDLESGESKRPRRKSKKSRSPSPPLHDMGIDGMVMDDMIDPLDMLPKPSRHHRSKSKSSKKSPTMSPAMLPTIPQSKTMPYPAHLTRNTSPAIEILELSALEKPSQERRRKTKRQSKQSSSDVGKVFRQLYDSTPSLDVIVQVILQPVETARKSEYPNLAIVIALVELLIFIWLLYQAIIILEFACAVVRFICYPAIYILKAVASSFPSMERL